MSEKKEAKKEESKEPIKKTLKDYPPQELEQKLREIQVKIDGGKELSFDEQVFVKEYEDAINVLQRANLEQEQENKRQEEVANQEKLNKEYASAPEEEKLPGSTEGEYIYRGHGKLNEFFANRKIKKMYKKVKKKGGSVLIKFYKDTSAELVWLKRPVTFVEFLSKDETGDIIRSVSRITKNKHRLKGSSVPVHLAIEGSSENVSLLEGVNTSLSAKYINGLLQSSFEAGRAFEADLEQNKKKKFDIASIGFILTLIMLAVLLYLAYQQYNLYELVMKMAPQAVAAATGGA